ncbi:MAG: hypothetical protein WC758_03645 [Candidatus Woesearchaeota archaeon]|jgi:hypothetical protein
MKLTGINCPKLFDKWQPLEFQDFTLNDVGEKYISVNKCKINQEYVFSFAEVNVNFDYEQCINQEITTRQIFTKTHDKDISYLFNKDILELYVDAKLFTQKHIDIASKIILELKDLNVDKYSMFQRSIRFKYTVDIDFNNVDLRNRVALDVYLSLKDHLDNTFSKKKEFFHSGQVMGFPIGTDETILLKNGINLDASGLPGPLNAGTIYLNIHCDENGTQNEFQKVFDETTNFIESIHKNKLIIYRSGSSLDFNLNGQGTRWAIFFPEIKYSKQISTFKQELIQIPFQF